MKKLNNYIIGLLGLLVALIAVFSLIVYNNAFEVITARREAPAPSFEFKETIPAQYQESVFNYLIEYLELESENIDGYLIGNLTTNAVFVNIWKFDSDTPENDRKFIRRGNYDEPLNPSKTSIKYINIPYGIGGFDSAGNPINSTSGTDTHLNPYYDNSITGWYTRSYASYNLTVLDSNNNIIFESPPIEEPEPEEPENPNYTGILSIIIEYLKNLGSSIASGFEFIIDEITDRINALTTLIELATNLIEELITNFGQFTLQPIRNFFNSINTNAIAFYRAFYGLPFISDFILVVLSLAVLGLIFKFLEG